jgi:hypothetical protein
MPPGDLAGMKMYTRGPGGEVSLKPVSEVQGAQKVQGEIVNNAEHNKPAPLPWLGEHGIFCRYLSAATIDGGKGRLYGDDEVLPFRNGSPKMLMERDGSAKVPSGFYNDGGVSHIYLNLGIGAVLYEYLPCNTGKITIDYYGDTIGPRALAITPYAVQAELLQDLNEAFKMLTAEMAKLYD